MNEVRKIQRIVDAEVCADAEMGVGTGSGIDSTPSSKRQGRKNDETPPEKNEASAFGKLAASFGLWCAMAFVSAMCFFSRGKSNQPILDGLSYPVVVRATFHGGPADADTALFGIDLDALGRGERVGTGRSGGITKRFLLHGEDDKSSLEEAVKKAENGVTWGIDKEHTERLEVMGDYEGMDKDKDRELGAAGYQTMNGFPCYRTVDGTLQTMLDIEATHPHLATVEKIGESFHGRGIFALKLSDSSSKAPKAPLVITAGIHAREYTPPELLLRFAELCVENFGSGASADIDWILAHREIHLVIQSNPDGRIIAETSRDAWWRKNANSRKCSDDWYGVDLNRNFGFMWGGAGASSDPCATTYRGASGGSESETAAIMSYSKSIFPLGQRKANPVRDVDTPYDESTSTGMYIDVHSAGEDVIYPWGHKDKAVGNFQAYQAIAHKLSSFNGYKPSGSGYNFLGTVSGDSLDYHYGELGICSILFELGTEFYQSCEDFETQILPDNLNALIYSAKLAHLPYQTAKGPDVISLSVPKEPVNSANVVIKATVSDQERTRVKEFPTVSSGSQRIASVRLTVDGHPYDLSPPQSRFMSPADGRPTFNSHTENAELSLDVSALAEGQHMICVVCTDVAGFEGPVSCDYLTVGPRTPTVSTGLQQTTSASKGLPDQQQQTTSSSEGVQNSGARPHSTTTTASPAAKHSLNTTTSKKCSALKSQGECKKSAGCKWKKVACLDMCEGRNKEDKCTKENACAWDGKAKLCSRRSS